MDSKILLYDSFNAKYLSFKDVAESFVANDQFNELTSTNSILLMGSRGCGKTTLLKMLSPISLSYWRGADAERLKKKINFTAIYIPSDIQWKSQYEYLLNNIAGDDKVANAITYYLFTSNIQIAICKTFHSFIQLTNLSEEEKIVKEYKISKNLIKSWNLHEQTKSTFDSIEITLLERIGNINSQINGYLYHQKLDVLLNAIPGHIHDDFLDKTRIGCKIFESELQLENNHKWALCFDELEIVPKFIQLKLIKYLRSVDQKFLFKLTSTPIFNLENIQIDASQGNDFGTIKLWVYDESGLRRWRNFCQKVLNKKFKNALTGVHGINLSDIFGENNLDSIIQNEFDNLDSYEKALISYNGSFVPGNRKGSSTNMLFKILANRDRSFNQFLQKRNINTSNPIPQTKLMEKSIFLKFKVDATYRLIYKKRSRKTPAIHYGLPYIFDLCDGNPRLVIGLIDEIVQASKSNSESNLLIAKEIQSNTIYKSSEKYYNLIKNHPDSTQIDQNKEFNLATNIIDKIGSYFFSKLVQEDFTPTSPTTFTIDEDVNHKYISLLEHALSLGSIVYLDPIESLSNSGIIGKRFRLSSFLTPKYKIPSRISHNVKLSTLLKTEDSKDQHKLDFKK